LRGYGLKNIYISSFPNGKEIFVRNYLAKMSLYLSCKTLKPKNKNLIRNSDNVKKQIINRYNAARYRCVRGVVFAG